MARRKNIKRINPRYFLNESVTRNQDESAVEENIMDDVERAQRGEIPPEQAARIKDAEDAMKSRAGDPDRHADWGQGEEEEELEEEQQLDEIWPFGGGQNKTQKNQKFWDKEGYELAKARLEKLGAKRGLHRQVEKEFVANSRLPDQMGVNAAVRDVLKRVKAGKDASQDRRDKDRSAAALAAQQAEEEEIKRKEAAEREKRLRASGDYFDPDAIAAKKAAHSAQWQRLQDKSARDRASANANSAGFNPRQGRGVRETVDRDQLTQIIREEIKRALKE